MGSIKATDMKRYIWSYISRVQEIQKDDFFRGISLFRLDHLQEMGLLPSTGLVPESLMVEACAQSTGLIFLLAEEMPTFLPVLGRINQANFYKQLLPDTPVVVCSRVRHCSDQGTESMVQMSEIDGSPIMDCELILGFIPLSELPGEGSQLVDHLKGFRAHLQWNG